MQLFSPGAFGFLLLLFPLELLFTLFGSPLLLLLVLLSLLFVVALAFFGLLLCLGFGRGCQRWGWIGGLFFCCSWVVYGAIVVYAYGESGPHALAQSAVVSVGSSSRFGPVPLRVIVIHFPIPQSIANDERTTSRGLCQPQLGRRAGRNGAADRWRFPNGELRIDP